MEVGRDALVKKTNKNNGILLGLAIVGFLSFGCGSSQPQQPTGTGNSGIGPNRDIQTGSSGIVNTNQGGLATAIPGGTASVMTPTSGAGGAITAGNNPVFGSPSPAVAVLPEGQAGQMLLPIGTIYNQGMMGWCWAFSAFHAIRTYYYDSPATDAATLSWRAAIKTIDSQTALPGALGSNLGSLIGGLTGGDPEEFINGFKSTKNLSAQNWQAIDVSDHAAALAQVTANIRKLIPSVFCDFDHCRMIYGFVSDGMQVTQFAMADSAADPSPTYLEDAATLSATLNELVTLVQ